jgi:hypothetical protein
LSVCQDRFCYREFPFVAVLDAASFPAANHDRVGTLGMLEAERDKASIKNIINDLMIVVKEKICGKN